LLVIFVKQLNKKMTIKDFSHWFS